MTANIAVTPGSGAIVETIDITGVERQSVTISDRAGNAVDSIGGLTETAPTTDTASSGLNGRLQRLAQNVSGSLRTYITADSGNQAATNAVATLAATSGKTTYITGFQITASGASSALVVTVTVAGVITGTLHYTFTFPSGVTTAATPLIVNFPTPIPASATNTTIVVTLPSSGTGGTNATVAAQGFQL